jgi:hypothetical protein
MERIIVHNVVHSPRTFNIISQVQILDNYITVSLYNSKGVNLYGCQEKFDTNAYQINGQFILNQLQESQSTQFTDLLNVSFLPASH